MSRFAADGLCLNIQVTGAGPALVVLHGFTGNLSTWETFAVEASRRHRLVMVDLPGHGGSESPPDPSYYTLESTVERIARSLDQLGIRRAAWMGYSLGGRVALTAGVRMPERCRSLVLEAASPGISNLPERAARAMQDRELAAFIEREGINAFVDRWENLPLFASQLKLPEKAREKLKAMRLGNSPQGLANSLRGASVGVQPALHSLLPSLRLPVLCLAGEDDIKFRAIAEDMCWALPDGRLCIIPHAGHCTHLEQPQAFIQAVLRFLAAEVPGNPGGRYGGVLLDGHPSPDV